MNRANQIRTNTNKAEIHFYTTKSKVSVKLLDMKDFYSSYMNGEYLFMIKAFIALCFG